jgi:GcrA cell cycle regulator
LGCGGADAVTVVEDTDIPIAQRRTLMELTATTCRWPVGHPRTPEFYFCGAHCCEDQPYCEAHMARAHTGKSE